MEEIKIPVIDNVDKISEEALAAFMRIGFCYVKLPESTQFEANKKTCRKQALEFFHQGDTYIEQFPFDKKEYAGVINRQKSLDEQLIIQVHFAPNKPLEPFKACQTEIEAIYHLFDDQIAKLLIKSVFEKVGAGEHFDKVMERNTNTFNFSHYDPSSAKHFKKDEEEVVGVNAHQDWGWATILDIDKPGLVARVGEQDIPVNPKPGYVVVNLGLCTQLMLGKTCHAAYHEVQRPPNERMSMIVFTAPDMKMPINNLLTGKLLYESYEVFTDGLMETSYVTKPIEGYSPQKLSKTPSRLLPPPHSADPRETGKGRLKPKMLSWPTSDEASPGTRIRNRSPESTGDPTTPFWSKLLTDAKGSADQEQEEKKAKGEEKESSTKITLG